MTPTTSDTSSEPARSASVIVTGAAGGIGSAEARVFVDAGHHVVANDVDRERLAETVAALGGAESATAVPGDIAAADTAKRLVAEATAGERKLAAVINNAGVTADRMVFNLSDTDWDRVMEINLRGTFVLTREAARYWRGLSKSTGRGVGAAIVNTTSRAGLLANPGQANYGSAKAGVAVLTQIAARELAAYGVRVNAVAPRAFTPMMQSSFGNFREEELDAWSPGHVARFVGHLCSAAGSDISGQVFVVRGREVSLARPWVIDPPVYVDLDSDAAAVSASFDEVFGPAERWIAPFQVGDDLPTVDGARA